MVQLLSDYAISHECLKNILETCSIYVRR